MRSILEKQLFILELKYNHMHNYYSMSEWNNFYIRMKKLLYRNEKNFYIGMKKLLYRNEKRF